MAMHECTTEFKKYLKKLHQVIENESKFDFWGTRIIDKSRFDDVFCCIEANWPADYKKFLQYLDARKLRSPMCYTALVAATKNKFFFSSSYYAVKYTKAIQAISSLMLSIDDDMTFIYGEQSGMH